MINYTLGYGTGHGGQSGKSHFSTAPMMKLICVIHLTTEATVIVTSNGAHEALFLFTSLWGGADGNLHSVFERVQKQEIGSYLFRWADLKYSAKHC